MTTSKNIIDKISEILTAALPSVAVLINTDTPEKIPSGGLIILRDGDPGEPETVLGGFRSCYYTHQIDLEIFVQIGNSQDRDTAFSLLVSQIGTVLESDITLDGLCQYMAYGLPQANTNDVSGSAGVKSAVLGVTVEYETQTPLS